MIESVPGDEKIVHLGTEPITVNGKTTILPHVRKCTVECILLLRVRGEDTSVQFFL
jgi:hypothetical protein